MKKTFLSLFAILALSGAASAQKKQYKDFTTDNSDLTISIVDIVTVEDVSKFKIKIKNKTNDYFIFRISESRFIINGKEITPTEKDIVIGPTETNAKVIDVDREKFTGEETFSYRLDGLYKVPVNGKSVSAADLRLPTSQTSFKAGGFDCEINKVHKITDATTLKFNCTYNGDKIGIVNMGKPVLKMPDGKEYANNSWARSIMIMKGDRENLNLIWEKVSNESSMDMQLVDMTVIWKDAFVESMPLKLEPRTIDFSTGSSVQASSSGTKNDVFSNAQTEKKQESASDPIAETAQYRGTGDPLKGLNVDKSNTLQVGDYYALIIGIDKYSGSWQPLKNAVSDAKAVETLLKKDYKIDHFKVLYDNQATRKNIITAMEWLAANAKEKDNVMIYYSGHGEYKEQLGKGFWVPFDAQTTSVSDYISNNDLQTFLAGIRSKHTLLISDACFSGDIFRGNTISVPFENSERYYKEVNELPSRQALTSGGVEPVMDGGKEGHSVFAYYLLKALSTNKNKFYDASQLYSSIKIPVTNNSEQSPQFRSIKNSGDEGGQFIFIRK